MCCVVARLGFSIFPGFSHASKAFLDEPRAPGTTSQSPLQPDYRGRRDPRRSACSCKHKALTTCLRDSQSPHHAKAHAFPPVFQRQQLYDVHQSLGLIVRCNAFLIARGKVKMASLVFSICQPLSAVDRCCVRLLIYLFCCR